MNLKNSKLFSFAMAVLLFIIGLIQFMEGNSSVSIFPIVCAFIFAYRGFTQQK